MDMYLHLKHHPLMFEKIPRQNHALTKLLSSMCTVSSHFNLHYLIIHYHILNYLKYACHSVRAVKNIDQTQCISSYFPEM